MLSIRQHKEERHGHGDYFTGTLIMIVVSWNIRGLGKPEKRAAVRKLVKKQRICVLFLQETKISKDITHIIQDTWGSQSCGWEWVSSEWESGGLITIWNNNLLKVEDINRSQRVLAIKFRNIKEDFLWAAANVYGPYEDSQRDGFWLLLTSIISQWALPWSVGGDFNVVRFPHVKRDGRSITRSMESFSECINENELLGMPLARRRFTWSNNQERAAMSRIDRL